jgi:hypothetical protein
MQGGLACLDREGRCTTTSIPHVAPYDTLYHKIELPQMKHPTYQDFPECGHRHVVNSVVVRGYVETGNVRPFDFGLYELPAGARKDGCWMQ